MDVPPDVVECLRGICERLPDAQMTFESEDAELDVLRRSGYPFFAPPWRASVVGMFIDDDTDWTEVAELVTDSYCVQAPLKLRRLVPRPG